MGAADEPLDGPCDGQDVIDELNDVFGDPQNDEDGNPQNPRFIHAKQNNNFATVKDGAGLYDAYVCAGVKQNKFWRDYLTTHLPAQDPDGAAKIAAARHSQLMNNFGVTAQTHLETDDPKVRGSHPTLIDAPYTCETS